MRDIFLHFLTLNQAIQDGWTGSNHASIIFRTWHRLKPYAGDDAPSGLRPCGGACDVGLTPHVGLCRAVGAGLMRKGLRCVGLKPYVG